MDRQTMSARNASCLIILAVLCVTVLSGVADVRQDLWLTILLAAVGALPLMLLYARLCALSGERGIFAAILEVFGKGLGRVIVAVIVLYAVFVTSLLLRNYVEFTVIIALQDTPHIPLMIALLLPAMYIAYKGPAVIGRWAMIVCVCVLANVMLTLVLSLDTIDFGHMEPILDHPIEQMANNGLTLGTIAFGELVLALPLLGRLKKGHSPYRALLWGCGIGTMFVVLVVLRNLMILGPEMVGSAKFSAYMAVRILHFGTFFERIESIISFNLILLGITKMVLALWAASNGAAALFDAEDSRKFLVPVAVLALAFCTIVFRDVFDMYDFAWAYRFFALPFQVLLPLLIWIGAEIRMRKRTRKVVA